MLISKTAMFFAKHKKLRNCLFVFGVIALLAGLGFIGNRFLRNNNHSELVSSIGPLVGAVIGGCFTLLGTVIINDQKQKAENEIRRKNVIYKPLYDELYLIHNEILKNDPFPNYVLIGDADTGPMHYPQYFVWSRIKTDSRVFEVPAKLAKALDVLYEEANAYLEAYQLAEKLINRVYREAISEVNLSISDNINISFPILNAVLNKERPDNDDLVWNTHTRITHEEANTIWEYICMACSQNPKINNLKHIQCKWFEAEEKALKMISEKIEYITNKYEA